MCLALIAYAGKFRDIVSASRFRIRLPCVASLGGHDVDRPMGAEVKECVGSREAEDTRK